MHVRRALALTVVIPLLLAGCTDDAEPTPKMPDPTTSSSSPTATETPDAESAEDFIRRWVAVNREMFATGETQEFLALGPDCEDCKEIAATVDRIYGAGGTVKWDGWKVLQLAPRGDPSAHAYRFVVQSAPTRYRDSPTGAWKTLKGGRAVQLIVLAQVGPSWHVLESKELPS